MRTERQQQIGIRSFLFVVAERPPPLQVSVLGRGAILRGRENRYTFVYANNGDTDVFMVPLYLRFPSYFTWRPDFRLLPTIQPLQGPPIDYSQVPLDYQRGNETIVPLFIPRIRARATGSLSIIITVPDRPEFANINFEISAQLGSPLLNFVPPASGAPQAANGFCADGAQRPAGSRVNAPTAEPSTDCLQGLQQIAFDVLGFVPGLTCVDQIGLFVFTQAGQYSQGGDGIGNGLGALAGAYSTAVGCVLGASPIGQIVNAVQTGIDIALTINACNEPPSRFRGRTVASMDPNDKVGSSGVGAPRYLNGETPFPYVIYFENLARSSAAAVSRG